jgi:hypothetical protein
LPVEYAPIIDEVLDTPCDGCGNSFGWDMNLYSSGSGWHFCELDSNGIVSTCRTFLYHATTTGWVWTANHDSQTVWGHSNSEPVGATIALDGEFNIYFTDSTEDQWGFLSN